MSYELEIGMTGRVDQVVTDDKTAAKFGSGNVLVYATPMMVGLMENAALKAVDPHLPKGYATVGIDLNVRHLAATPVGMGVYATAKLTKIEGKKLSFTIEAFDDEEKIGEGSHDRYIINLEKFLSATDEKKIRQNNR